MPMIKTTLNIAIEICVPIIAICAIWMPDQRINQSIKYVRIYTSSKCTNCAFIELKSFVKKILKKSKWNKKKALSHYSITYHNKRLRDLDSSWNLHLFAIQTL